MEHTPSPDSILPSLREATGAAHQRLEDIIAIDRCLTDVARYRQLLEIFYGFYRPLEFLLFEGYPWQEVGLDVSGRYKIPWIEDDLLELGLLGPNIRSLPVCSQLPDTGSLSLAFGCLYVLEGATLGGQHISAMMARSIVPVGARRFFGGYGDQTGKRWREFIGAFELHAVGAGDAGRGDIIRGASETFGCLHHWYVRQCPTNEFCG